MQSIHPVHLARGIKWRAMVAMAKAHRRYLKGVPFIGITGSCAKTTTKTLLAGILSGQHRVTLNPGSKNRTEALARTILKARKGDICIQELGASGVGSLDAMLRTFKPTVAVITNVMRDHFAAYRSLDAIAAEKSKLVAALPPTGTAVLNADDPRVLEMGKKTQGHVMTYGRERSADLCATGFDCAWPGCLEGEVVWQGQRYPIQTRLLGKHWTHAVLAAMATALALGVSMEEVATRLAGIDPPEGRYSTVPLPNGATMICDDFKTPDHSIPPALAFMRKAKAVRKIMIIGHISDFSCSSSHKYKRVASDAITVCHKVLFVNPFASPKLKQHSARHRERVHCFDQLRSARDFLMDITRPGDLVLIKGIRKMDHLERLAMAFKEKVVCWQTKCALPGHCRQCPKRHRPTP